LLRKFAQEIVMAALSDPVRKYPAPPFKRQLQPWPGLAGKMEPPPHHGERSYRGSGRLMGTKGIRVNGVAPGPIWTPLQVSGGASMEQLEKFSGETVFKRRGQPVELASNPCPACRREFLRPTRSMDLRAVPTSRDERNGAILHCICCCDGLRLARRS
jgi:hypothetical protein